MVSVDVQRLLHEFDAAVAEHLARFKPIETAQIPMGRLYGWCRSDGLATFILFHKFPIRNRFIVDAAWSVHQRFPSHLSPMAVRPVPYADISIDNPVDGEFVFRVSNLWAPGKDESWRVGTNNFDQVYGVARKLDEVLVPYFEQVAPEQAGGWSKGTQVE